MSEPLQQGQAWLMEEAGLTEPSERASSSEPPEPLPPIQVQMWDPLGPLGMQA